MWLHVALVQLLHLLMLLRHPAIQALQLQASLVLCVGVVGWSVGALRRGRERQRLLAGGYSAVLARYEAAAAAAQKAAVPAAVQDAARPARVEQRRQQHTVQDGVQRGCSLSTRLPSTGSIFKSQCTSTGWPPLAVICPVKGCRSASVANWTSQLAAHYDGPRLFVFAVESAADAAVPALEALLQRQGAVRVGCQKQQRAAGRVLALWQQPAAGHAVVVVAAGLASTCSQKILNILKGIEVGLPVLQQQCQQQQQQSQAAPAGAAAGKQHPRAAAGGGSSGGGSSVCVYAVASSDTDDEEGAATPAAAAAAAPAASADAGGACVCVLDDDVRLHPLSLLQLVDELAAHPSLFMVTGYPLDIVCAPPPPPSAPPRGSSSSASSSSGGCHASACCPPSLFARLLSHAAASYHLPLAIGFSVADTGAFVWGGVMCMRAERLSQRVFGGGAAAAPSSDDRTAAAAAAAAAGRVSQQPPTLLEVWADGGYSDDLLAAGFCGARGLPIGLPASALFPQLLPPGMGFSSYWNYLRRQLFVLDTYWAPADRATNRALMVVHSYASAVFTAAVAATLVQLAAAAVLLCAAVAGTAVAGGPGAGAAAAASWWRPLLLEAGAPGGSTLRAAGGGGGGSPTSLAAAVTWALRCCVSPGCAVFVAVVAASQAAIALMVHEALALFGLLSPAAGDAVLAPRTCFALLWAGWVFENALLPVAMAVTAASSCVTWGGIAYEKRRGRVACVAHPPPV